MAQVKEKKLSPKQAVDEAFRHFKELYECDILSHLLLEGLRYDETRNLWEVTIGFDIGREKIVGGPLSFAEKKLEPIREFRVIRLNAEDGAFIGLDHV
ncbi:hypothetical protein ABIE58_000937 [Roseovarius sp. MBR-78]|jgi:hypothetical protein|uniref:hypothetical protein n=1 Tax=Roseovarius sp. MBR-78 TaxID=3156460 RepID=UPI003395C44C